MIFAVFCCIAGVALFFGVALRQNIRFFVTPTQVFEENLLHHKHLRLGGEVKEQSLKQKDLISHFIITDGSIDIPVVYIGLLPDLFREGQMIVAEGHFDPDRENIFEASTILAKHDENYRPPQLRKKNEPRSKNETLQNRRTQP